MNQKKGMPIIGEFIQQGDDTVFCGGRYADNNSLIGINGNSSKSGLYMYGEKFLSGTIAADFVFEADNINTAFEHAEIVFNYVNSADFMCAGITGDTYKYELRSYKNNNWQSLMLSGWNSKLQLKEYHLELEIFSSWLRMKVNDVEVFTAALPYPRSRSQIGIWTSSFSNIRISNFTLDSKKPEVFVISQFGGMYDELYNEVIKVVCRDYNTSPVRVDEYPNSSLILNDIIASIRRADIIIADITPNNPNVFYEVGYAHALGKQVLLVCEKTERQTLPFDVSGFRTIFYENSIAGKTLVETELKKYIKKALGRIGCGI